MKKAGVEVPQLTKKLGHLFNQFKNKTVGDNERLEAGKTILARKMGLSKSYFNQRTADTLPACVERFVVLRYGFGPTDDELKDGEPGWESWKRRRPAWRTGTSADFCKDLVDHPNFPRPVGHPELINAMSEIEKISPTTKPYVSNGVLVTRHERHLLSRAFWWINDISVNPRGTGVPTISHLMQVCGVILENHGTINEAIAALLHDVVEDYSDTLPIIKRKFGEEVANIVWECSDSRLKFGQKREEWFSRKVQYLSHLQDRSVSCLRVLSADKLHNARAMLRDSRAEGDRLWDQINRTKEETIAYYVTAHSRLRTLNPSAITSELGITVALLENSPCDEEDLAEAINNFASALKI